MRAQLPELKNKNQPGTPKLKALLEVREVLLVENENSQLACLLPHQRKRATYYLQLYFREWILYIIFIGIHIIE